MSLTLASGSVTESLHLIQDLLISQLRLTGTCSYLSDFATQIRIMPSMPPPSYVEIRLTAAALELALKSALDEHKV